MELNPFKNVRNKKKIKVAKLYSENIGVKVGNFSHKYSETVGDTALGVVCGYGDSDIIVKLTNCEGWTEAQMKKVNIKTFVEKESKNHPNGYWFISKRELEELSVVYNVDVIEYDTGRNEPCICGSGKKFKKCCLHRV